MRSSAPRSPAWIINTGVKLADKPSGYQPPVTNWVPDQAAAGVAVSR